MVGLVVRDGGMTIQLLLMEGSLSGVGRRVWEKKSNECAPRVWVEKRAERDGVSGTGKEPASRRSRSGGQKNVDARQEGVTVQRVGWWWRAWR